MTDTAGQTTTIELTVHIAAPPETVWGFWTDPDRLVKWWGTSAEVEPHPGALYRVTMESGPIMRGELIDLDPPHHLAFTFGWEQNAPGEPLAPGSTRVEVTLTAEGDGTLVLLRHTEMPETHAPDHDTGWQHYLGERLVALGEQA